MTSRPAAGDIAAVDPVPGDVAGADSVVGDVAGAAPRRALGLPDEAGADPVAGDVPRAAPRHAPGLPDEAGADSVVGDVAGAAPRRALGLPDEAGADPVAGDVPRAAPRRALGLPDEAGADSVAGNVLSAALRAGSHVTRLANGATASRLHGGRVFLQHGPINLIVRAGGTASAVEDACRALIDAFPSWLGALVAELPRLRSPESPGLALPAGPIAHRMVAAARACTETSGTFVTPMAAVAGAVADEAAAVLAARPGIEHAYVNNGGDIALHLTPGARLSVGVVPTLRDAIPRARIGIGADSAVRGVATSGWRGRSHSLGVADAVTVLARSAALADAAATLVASAADVDHPGIRREPARVLDEDSDLGDRPVTVAVPALDAEAIEAALDAGATAARALRARGVIEGAALTVQGRWRVLEDFGAEPGEARGRTGATGAGRLRKRA